MRHGFVESKGFTVEADWIIFPKAMVRLVQMTAIVTLRRSHVCAVLGDLDGKECVVKTIDGTTYQVPCNAAEVVAAL